MLEEQLRTIQLFREHYNPQMTDKLVIYGTGINAEAVIKSCNDYPIVGLMDASKTGQNFWGKQVLSEQEVLDIGVHLIVVIARPAVHTIIYKRLQSWSEKYGIQILNIWGEKIADKILKDKCESPYFDISYKQLLSQIEKYDVITFDIFDTLVTRKVYEPQDVFLILDREYEGRFPFVFSDERKRAELELLSQGEPNIYQIYQQMRKNNPCLSKKECQSLLSREVQKECQILTPRKKMLECLKYCEEKQKRVFLVSDMYLPEEIQKDILTQLDITQYEKIFVSCDYGVSKRNGLFRIVKEYVGYKCTYLHIGDNVEADGAAENEEMGLFLIMSPLHMMEISTYSSILTYLELLETRIMLGLLLSEVFNNPFILENSHGKPSIVKKWSFGYAFIAPLVFSFVIWMLNKLESKAIILFSARDGWFIQKIYHLLKEKFQMDNLPKDEYLLISRKAMMLLDESNNRDRKNRYLCYLSGFHLEKFEKIYFFDFMSRGTCHYYLETLIGRKLCGLYFQKSISCDEEKNQLRVETYYEEKSPQDTQKNIFALCDFLECIFTSFEPSFLEIDELGRAVYSKERRSDEQLSSVKEIHQGIWDYSQQFIEVMGSVPKQIPPVEFGDKILGFISSSRSKIFIPELESIVLDDVDNGDKNVGLDALV